MTQPWSDSDAHLASLGRARRRDLGVVYTPDTVVDFLLEQEFGESGGPLGPVLDPACGTGAILKAVVIRIADDLANQGVDIRGAGRRRFLEEVLRLVWGVDVDARAVNICRRELRDLLETLSPGPISANLLDDNIVHGDFLRRVPTAIVQSSPRHIVGNPPYVAADRISAEAKRYYRLQFASAVGRFDLYYLFMERASEIVIEGGSWTLITPDKYLNSTSGQHLRRYLHEGGEIRFISRFRSHDVFNDAATVPCITSWSRTRATCAHASARHVELGTGPGEVLVRNATKVARERFARGAWIFHHSDEESLLNKIRSTHPPLRQHVSRISAGLTTGFNPAFIIPEAAAGEVEPELLHRTIRGRDIGPYVVAEPRLLMLVPYVWRGDNAQLIDLADFPKTERWLRQHRPRLEARHAVKTWGKAWWDLHDPVTTPLQRTPKLVVPDVAKHNRFAYDSGRFVPQHSVYYLIPMGIEGDLLTAILNTPAVELLIRSTAPRVKDGFSRYRRQFLLDLPIPEVDEGASRRILQAVRAGEHDRATNLATELFDLDLDDVERGLRQISLSR